MIEGLRIRHVSESDLPAIEESFDLWKFRLNNERALMEHRLGRLIWMIAELDGVPVGSVWGELFPEHDRAGHTIHVVAFRVHPSVQRRGIGTVLLDAVEQAGAGYGRTVASLFVAQDNAPAISLYAKTGYEVVDVRFARWEFDDPAGDHHLITEEQFVMRKDLASRPTVAPKA